MSDWQSGDSFQSPLKQFHLAVVVFLFLIAWCAYAAAATKTWSPGPNDVLWHDAGAWTPTGVPTTNDNAVINSARLVVLDGGTGEINELEMRGGATLSTNGKVLQVRQPNGLGTIQLDGSTTQLLVAPHESLLASTVRTHDLNLSGSSLVMSGGNADVRGRLNVTSGAVHGRGTVFLLGSGTNLVNNNGEIRADGGDLTLRATLGTGRFNLDGTNGETSAALLAVDGSSGLQIDGLLTDAFDGRLVIGAGNAIAFRQAGELGVNSIVFFEGNNEPATIGGLFGTGHFTSGGIMNVSTGVAVIDQAQIDFTSTSIISVAGGTKLALEADATHAGNLSLSGGELTGDGTMTNSGEIVGRGLITVDNIVNDGLIWAQNGTLTIDTVNDVPRLSGTLNTGVLRATTGATLEVRYPPRLIGFAGEVDAAGGTFSVPDINLLLNPGGKVKLSSGGRLFANGFTQLPGSSLEVGGVIATRIDTTNLIKFGGSNEVAGPLSLDGEMLVQSTAMFTGDGNIFLRSGNELRAEDGARIGVAVFNEGRLTPGVDGENSTGRLSFDSIQNADSGELVLEIAGTAPGLDFDQLTGDALFAGGILNVDLLNGYKPIPGQSFQLLSFDAINGEFATLLLPTEVNWDTSQLLTTGTITVLPGLPADFDDDRDVDGEDLSEWQGDFGVNAGSDADSDNDSDGRDFLVWQQQEGMIEPLPISQAVPEPNSLILVLLIIAPCLNTRMRRTTLCF